MKGDPERRVLNEDGLYRRGAPSLAAERLHSHAHTSRLSDDWTQLAVVTAAGLSDNESVDSVSFVMHRQKQTKRKQKKERERNNRRNDVFLFFCVFGGQ